MAIHAVSLWTKTQVKTITQKMVAKDDDGLKSRLQSVFLGMRRNSNVMEQSHKNWQRGQQRQKKKQTPLFCHQTVAKALSADFKNVYAGDDYKGEIKPNKVKKFSLQLRQTNFFFFAVDLCSVLVKSCVRRLSSSAN